MKEALLLERSEAVVFSVGDLISVREAVLLSPCPYIRRLKFTPRPAVRRSRYHSWNMCSLDGCHCDISGVRLKYHRVFRGAKVMFVCPKLAGLPDLGVSIG